MYLNSNSEIARLEKALNFLTSHLPGASELAELVKSETMTHENNHVEDAETILVGEQPNVSISDKSQKALEELLNLKNPLKMIRLKLGHQTLR